MLKRIRRKYQKPKQKVRISIFKFIFLKDDKMNIGLSQKVAAKASRGFVFNLITNASENTHDYEETNRQNAEVEKDVQGFMHFFLILTNV